MPIDRDPAVIAYQLADETRALAAATAKPDDAYPDVAALLAVAEGVHLTVHQLPEVAEKFSAGLRALEERGALKDPADEVSGALRALLDAGRYLVLARQELRAVEAAVAGLEGEGVSA
ncbi:hypothetical protein ACFYXD_35325 [Streptomyces platensis]|uniref:hypothetical protein n=1 Tax=Streptomyces platensis TaxID=58346 RepID=UPI0036887360